MGSVLVLELAQALAVALALALALLSSGVGSGVVGAGGGARGANVGGQGRASQIRRPRRLRPTCAAKDQQTSLWSRVSITGRGASGGGQRWNGQRRLWRPFQALQESTPFHSVRRSVLSALQPLKHGI